MRGNSSNRLLNRLPKKENDVAEPESPENKQVQSKQDSWWEFCPICGAKLVDRKCKFVCSNPECHYFQSCSEFDT
jgi:hypothetical protein